MLSQIIFTVILLGAIALFTINVRKISRNIKLGRPFDRNDQPGRRWSTMFLVAIGQSKMVKRPLAGIMHVLVYAGFIIINIEVLEILIDGVAGTDRALSFLGGFYTFLITAFEILAAGVMLGCITFLIRRNIGRLKRLHSPELTKWPLTDANIILVTEVLLMTAFLLYNGANQFENKQPLYLISQVFFPLFSNMHDWAVTAIMHFCWWFHIIGILAFLNYIPYSKHFHIVLSFPNVYYSNLQPKGEFTNVPSVTREVKLMLGLAPPPPEGGIQNPPSEGREAERFGAKDVFDLSWKQLMDAYSCTECGRCTSSCPANITGKLLSPRKIMMDTRDRLEEVGKNIDKNKGKFVDDGKSLLNDYILPEELWACNSCNACTEECPVNIDPLSIIVDMRRYLVMEQSAPPQALAQMCTNIENNGAPWQFPASDRFNWANSV